MAVASLIFGILSFVVFWWLGPVLGSTWAGALMAGAVMKGTPQVITWPIWVLGLGIGVAVPLVAVVLGGVGLAKDDAKGVAIGGLVTGAVGAVGGLILTAVLSFTITAGAAALSGGGDLLDDKDVQQGMQQMMDQLNDPDFQQQMQKALQNAQVQQPAPTNQPQPAQPTPQPAAPPTPTEPTPAPPVQPVPLPAQ
jgi:hypothetical protein